MSLSDLALLFSILAIAGTIIVVIFGDVIGRFIDWALDIERGC